MLEAKTNIENNISIESNNKAKALTVSSKELSDQWSLRCVEDEYCKAVAAYDPEAQWTWIQAGIDIAGQISATELLRFKTFRADFYYEIEHRHELAISELRSALGEAILAEQFLSPSFEKATTQFYEWLRQFSRARVSAGVPIEPEFDFYEIRLLLVEILNHYDEYRMDRTLPGQQDLTWREYLKASSMAARLKTSFAVEL
jgi:hypothetical protein